MTWREDIERQVLAVMGTFISPGGVAIRAEETRHLSVADYKRLFQATNCVNLLAWCGAGPGTLCYCGPRLDRAGGEDEVYVVGHPFWYRPEGWNEAPRGFFFGENVPSIGLPYPPVDFEAVFGHETWRDRPPML